MEKLNKLYYIIIYILQFIRTIYIKPLYRLKKQEGNIHILGNGPSSLKTFYNRYKKGDKVIVCNFFLKNEHFFKIKPKYYIIIDPYFYEYKNNQKLDEFYNKLNKIDWDINLILLGHLEKEMKSRLPITNSKIKILRLKYAPLEIMNKYVYKLYKFNLATPKFQNVIVSSIYISLNLGFKNLFLHGVESNSVNNFKIDKDNNILLQEEHSYGKSIINLTDENGDMPKYLGLFRKGEFYKRLKCEVDMFYNYYLLEKYSKHLKSQIINYTPFSYIDAFEKKNCDREEK
ncbi:MAG: hypothetical protein RSA05_05205 [Cetobacterium sp.]